MHEIILGILSSMLSLYMEVAFYLLLGFTFAGLLYGIFPDHIIQKHLGQYNFSSVLKAALLGVPLPLCSCGVLPTAFSLRKQGASRSATTSFLISTPQTGVDSILVTYAFLGPLFAAFRPIAALISGVVGGTLVNKFDSQQHEASLQKRDDASGALPSSWKSRILLMLKYAYVEFPAGIAKWMLIGIGLAGIIAYVVPDDFFSRHLESDLLSMLLFLVVGIPFYTCSTGSVPIAAVLLMKGLSPGAVFVFLVVGPVTSIASLTMILKLLGKRLAGLYLGTIVTSALLFGFLLNAVYGFFDIPATIAHAHEHGKSGWALFWAIILGLILARVFVTQFLSYCRHKGGSAMSADNQLLLQVEGMTCQHCVKTVKDAVSALDSDATVDVDLKAGRVSVSGGSISREAASSAIQQKGYSVKQ